MGDLWGQWACSTGVEHSVGAYCVHLTASLTASLMRGAPGAGLCFEPPPLHAPVPRFLPYWWRSSAAVSLRLQWGCAEASLGWWGGSLPSAGWP